MSDQMEILNIVLKYCGDKNPIAGAGHDVIFLNINDKDLNIDDATRLEELNACFSSEYDCWIKFV